MFFFLLYSIFYLVLVLLNSWFDLSKLFLNLRFSFLASHNGKILVLLRIGAAAKNLLDYLGVLCFKYF